MEEENFNQNNRPYSEICPAKLINFNARNNWEIR